MREIGPNHYVACHFPLEPARWDEPDEQEIDQVTQ